MSEVHIGFTTEEGSSSAVVFRGLRISSVERGLGAYRLRIFYSARWEQSDPRRRCLAVTGTVSAVGARTGGSFIGPLVTDSELSGRGESQHSLLLYLSPQQLEAVETVRDGGDLHLSIDFRLSLSNMMGCPGNSGSLVVPQSEWVKLLSTCGFRPAKLIEIPVFPEGSGRWLAAASKHFDAAVQQFQHGNYRQAIGTCREVYDALQQHLGEPENLPSNKKEFGKLERVCDARRALRRYSHLGHHDAEAVVDFNRIDAKWVLETTASFLSWVAAQPAGAAASLGAPPASPP